MTKGVAVRRPSAVECENCAKNARYGYEIASRACFWPVAMFAPNVQRAKAISDELSARYQNARSEATRRGTADLLDLATTLGGKTVPVTTVAVSFAYDFFMRERALYAAYARQVEAGLRAPAEDLDDKRRRIADTSLYAGSGADINFAALSLDGYGVSAWGDIHLELDQRAVGYRSSVLEENSLKGLRRRKHPENRCRWVRDRT